MYEIDMSLLDRSLQFHNSKIWFATFIKIKVYDNMVPDNNCLISDLCSDEDFFNRKKKYKIHDQVVIIKGIDNMI